MNYEDSDLYPGIEPGFLKAERVIVSFVCLLSVGGAIAVIFSFLCDTETKFSVKHLFHKICCGYTIRERSDGKMVQKYRLKSYNFILINLSVADIIVAASHLWGLQMNLKNEFARNHTDFDQRNLSAIPAGQNSACVTQAAFTVLSTMSSFFWTDILAVFLAFNLMCDRCSTNSLMKYFSSKTYREQRRRQACGGEMEDEEAPPQHDEPGDEDLDIQYDIPEDIDAPNCCETPFFLYILFPLIGWGVPMMMVVSFAMVKGGGVLGFTEDYDGGWCYFFVDPNKMNDKQRDIKLLVIFGYEVWIWGSMLLVFACTLALTCAACCRKYMHKLNCLEGYYGHEQGVTDAMIKTENDAYDTGCTEWRYLFVGAAFIGLRILSTIVNIILLADSESYRSLSIAVLSIFADASVSMQGLANGIIYCFCRNCTKEKCCTKKNGYKAA